MEKYNKLTFISYTEPKIRKNGQKRKMASFKCECGNDKIYDYSAVKRGHTKQCFPCSRISTGEKMSKHKLTTHPLYRKWQDMLNRCRNPKVDRYERYGGRGIIVCDEWVNDFKSFYDWSIKSGWKKGLTIDRKNVGGNYEPSNCRFIKSVEQGFNKVNTFYVIVNGVEVSLAKLMYINGLSHKRSVVWRGLKDGRTIEYYINKLGMEKTSIIDLVENTKDAPLNKLF